jgi:ketosteroid isomerase-like protein
MSDDPAMRALAKHFFDCVEAGDVDSLVACYAPDARIWHNTDRQEQGPADNAATLKGMVTRIVDRTYADRRVQVFPTGFVQQHVLQGTRKHDGARLELPACIVCEVKDGKITRLDEYFDSAGVAEFRKFA